MNLIKLLDNIHRLEFARCMRMSILLTIQMKKLLQMC